MVPEAVAQEKANGSLGGWIEALKKPVTKGISFGTGEGEWNM